MRRIALVLIFSACHMPGVQGSGKPAHDVRHVGSFDSIDVGGALDADITVGSAQDVTVDGDDNVVPLVRTELEGHVLRLRTKGSYHPQLPLIVHVTVPSLSGIAVSGAGHVRAQGIQGGDLALSVGGAGDVTAAGSAHQVTVDLSGAGSIDASALHAERATVKVGGAGSVDVYATQSLSATIAGAGHVRYDGHPAQIDKQISGVGSLEAR